jgi:hypothetical protein
MKTEIFQKGLKQIQRRLIFVAITGILLLICGAVTNPQQFFISYLFGYLFWLGLSIGCLNITMIHHLTGGRWGFPTRRVMEAAFSTLPLMTFLIIPIFFGLNDLYPWANSNILNESATLQKRLPYVTPIGFIIRSVVALLIWNTIAWCLRQRSLEQDKTQDPKPTRRLMNVSGPGIVISCLTVTFAYVDWIMSLEIQWFSTMFPVIVLAGQVLTAYAFCIIWQKLLEEVDGVLEIITPESYHQLGNLLLAFVMFWTYVSFGQLLIIYSGNLPREINWYLHRIAGNWTWIVGALALFHFFLPFFLLLFRSAKVRSNFLVRLAILIFIIHVVDVYWMIEPSFFQEDIHIHWLDFIAPLCVGSVWCLVFLWQLGRAPLLSLNDPRLVEAMKEETIYAG